MTDPSLALQNVVRAALVADVNVVGVVPAEQIVDSTGSLTSFPAIVVGEGQSIGEFATLKRDTARVYLDLHCWTRSDDLAAVKALAGAVRESLRDPKSWSSPDGYAICDAFIQSVRYLRDHEGETPLAHAVLTINALLQEAA